MNEYKVVCPGGERKSGGETSDKVQALSKLFFLLILALLYENMQSLNAAIWRNKRTRKCKEDEEKICSIYHDLNRLTLHFEGVGH